jgi:hypothetical protein
MSYTLKISVYNNRDYEQPFILKNSDGSAFNLTGCTLSFGYANDEKTLAIHTTGNPSNKCLTITNAVAGEFKLSLPYSVLKTLAVGAYTHDLIVTDATTKRTGVWGGTMQVKKGVA